MERRSKGTPRKKKRHPKNEKKRKEREKLMSVWRSASFFSFVSFVRRSVSSMNTKAVKSRKSPVEEGGLKGRDVPERMGEGGGRSIPFVCLPGWGLESDRSSRGDRGDRCCRWYGCLIRKFVDLWCVSWKALNPERCPSFKPKTQIEKPTGFTRISSYQLKEWTQDENENEEMYI